MTVSVFITATGTDAGKTYTGIRLIKAAKDCGLTVCATKPVMSGFSVNQLPASDAGLLAEALNGDLSIEHIEKICPWHFVKALAPSHAARYENRELSFTDILSYCISRKNIPCDFHIFEGAGGIMSPVTADRHNLDFLSGMEIPCLLVVPAYLGAVSHTLTAITSMNAAGRSPVAIILNDVHDNPPMADIVESDIRQFAPAIPVFRTGFPGTRPDREKEILKTLRISG